MPSSPSTRLRLNLQATGENSGSWGTKLNGEALGLLDEAIAGVETIALSGNLTLTATNYVSDQARNPVLVFTNNALASAPTVTVPSAEKWYFIRNTTAYAITIKANGVTDGIVPAGRDCFVIINSSYNVTVIDYVAVTAASAAAALASQTAAGTSATSAATSATLSQSWAATLAALVAATDYSAKEYAIGDLTASGGSAKAWAIDASSPNGTTDKSAKTLAAEAAASAAAAAASAATTTPVATQITAAAAKTTPVDADVLAITDSAASHVLKKVTWANIKATIAAAFVAAANTWTGAQQFGQVSGTATAVAALDIDCSVGNFFTKTIAGASTFTVSNVPSSKSYAFTLLLTYTSGTITWFSGVNWKGGIAPVLTGGKKYLVMFHTPDGGTTWRASALEFSA